MRRDEVRRHWEELASRYGTALTATTKTETIKRLEIAALERALVGAGLGGEASVLEVGCGNGRNCFALAERLPSCRFTGVDYVPQMIENAKALFAERGGDERLRFVVADALDLVDAPGLEESYDVVFTDRCLINLDSRSLQLVAVDQLVQKTRPGGLVLILENFVEGHARQNALRAAVGLPERAQADYNVFMGEAELLRHVEDQLELVAVDDFGSLHDLILYVLVPMAKGGEVDYDDSLVAAATELSLLMPNELRELGRFGQNRLLVFRRP